MPLTSFGATPARRAFLLLAAFSVFAALLLAWVAGERIVGLEMDDPWYMWFAWRLAQGELTDPLFGAAGPQLFGRIWVTLLSVVYPMGDWQLSAGHILPLSCIAAAAAIWFLLARRLQFSLQQSLFLATLLVVYHPFLRAGLSARPEAFIWFLTAAALLAFSSRRNFVAGLLAGLAIETHPMGMIACVYLLAWAMRTHGEYKQGELRQALFRTGLGLAAAGAGYLFLHGGFLFSPGGQGQVAGYAAMVSFRTPLLAYLEEGDLLRRLAGLTLILGASLLYALSGAWRRERLPLYLLAGLLMLALLVPRPNPLYFMYYAPVFLLAVTASIRAQAPLFAVLATMATLLLGDYLLVARANRAFSQHALEAALRERLAGSGLPVLTTAAFWPALRCQADIASMQHYPRLVREGAPFFVLLPRNHDIPLVFPPGTAMQEVSIAPRAGFVLHRVRPETPGPAQSRSFRVCN